MFGKSQNRKCVLYGPGIRALREKAKTSRNRKSSNPVNLTKIFSSQKPSFFESATAGTRLYACSEVARPRPSWIYSVRRAWFPTVCGRGYFGNEVHYRRMSALWNNNVLAKNTSCRNFSHSTVFLVWKRHEGKRGLTMLQGQENWTNSPEKHYLRLFLKENVLYLPQESLRCENLRNSQT